MKRNFLLITGLAVLLAGGRLATAQTTVTVTSPDGSTAVSSADITNITVYTNGQDRRNRRTAGNQPDQTRGFNRRGGYTTGIGGYAAGGGAGGEFSIIANNNIFDTSRYLRIRNTNIVIPPPMRYYFTLLGTGKYANDASAFFSDTGIERNNRAFALAETINGFKIAEITNDAVKLLSPSNEVINLKIGMQMSHTNNGAWQLVATTEPVTTSSASSDASDTSPDASSGPSAPESDIAKRLRLRREAEMGGPSPSGDAAPAADPSVNSPTGNGVTPQ